MSTLQQNISINLDHLAEIISPIFLELAFGSTLILIAAAIINVLLFRAAASLRYRIWTLALVGVIFFPLLTPLMPRVSPLMTWEHRKTEQAISSLSQQQETALIDSTTVPRLDDAVFPGYVVPVNMTANDPLSVSMISETSLPEISTTSPPEVPAFVSATASLPIETILAEPASS